MDSGHARSSPCSVPVRAARHHPHPGVRGGWRWAIGGRTELPGQTRLDLRFRADYRSAAHILVKPTFALRLSADALCSSHVRLDAIPPPRSFSSAYRCRLCAGGSESRCPSWLLAAPPVILAHWSGKLPPGHPRLPSPVCEARSRPGGGNPVRAGCCDQTDAVHPRPVALLAGVTAARWHSAALTACASPRSLGLCFGVSRGWAGSMPCRGSILFLPMRRVFARHVTPMRWPRYGLESRG